MINFILVYMRIFRSELCETYWYAHWADSVLNLVDPVPWLSRLSADWANLVVSDQTVMVASHDQLVDQVSDLVDPLKWANSIQEWADLVFRIRKFCTKMM